MRPIRSLALALLLGCGQPADPGTDSGEPATGSPTGTTAGTTTTGLATGTPAGSTTPSAAPDFRQRGPYDTVSADATVPVVTCEMDLTTYVPDGIAPLGFAVLAHGFQRNKSHVAALADHWASWGLAVVTPNLCHTSVFDTNHVENAQDLAVLPEALGHAGPVLYAGHSAGGLGTWLAASEAPATIAHLGLDPVDTGGLGSGVDGAHGVPTFALFGEPEACNSNSNAVGWYASGPDDRALRITGADHCDFEGPTDGLCTAFCATGAGPDETVRQIVTGTSTAFAMWQTGADPLGELWWTPGDPWFDLVLGGATEL